MDQVLEIIKKVVNIKKFDFFAKTVLFILVGISFFKLDSINTVFKTVTFFSLGPIEWIRSNENLIIAISDIYLLFQFIVLLLFVLSSRTNLYFFELQRLYEFLVNLYTYYLLFAQLFYNLGVIKFGFFQLAEYYINKTGFIHFPLMLNFILNTFFLVSMVVSYFYQKK